MAAESARTSLRESAKEYAAIQDAKKTPEELAKAKSAELAKNAMEFVPGRGLVPVEAPESKEQACASPRTPHASSAVAAQVEQALQHTDKMLDEEVRAFLDSRRVQTSQLRRPRSRARARQLANGGLLWWYSRRCSSTSCG